MLSANDRDPSRAFPDPALPAALVADPELTSSAKLVAAILLRYARRKAHCWPANGTIARDAGFSPATAKRGLAALRRRGYVRVERVPVGRGNMTGRMIVLTWREAAQGEPGRGRPPFLGGSDPGGRAPVSHEGFEKEPVQDNVTARRQGPPDRQTLPPPGPPPVPIPARSTAELIRELPGRPGSADAVACRLAADLRDQGSVAYYRARCSEVARGHHPVERLADAYQAGKAAAQATKPGAIFSIFWKGWIPRPRPAAVAAPSEATARRREAAAEAERRGNEAAEFLAAAAVDPTNPWYAILRRRPAPGASQAAGGGSGSGPVDSDASTTGRTQGGDADAGPARRSRAG